jgi:hypothetical protein
MVISRSALLLPVAASYPELENHVGLRGKGMKIAGAGDPLPAPATAR